MMYYVLVNEETKFIYLGISKDLKNWEHYEAYKITEFFWSGYDAIVDEKRKYSLNLNHSNDGKNWKRLDWFKKDGYIPAITKIHENQFLIATNTEHDNESESSVLTHVTIWIWKDQKFRIPIII